MCFSAIATIGAGLMGMSSANRAADAQTRASDDALAAQQAGAAQATNTLLGGQDRVLQALNHGGIQSRDNIHNGYQIGVNALNTGYQNASGQLNPIAQRGDTAGAAYDYNLGIGSRPEGYTGYENTAYQNYIMGQSRDAIDGSAAARGGLFSGATLRAQQENATGLAGQFYGDYMNRLDGVSQGGIAARGALAGMDVAQGNALANLAGTRGANLSNLNTNLAGDRASVRGNTTAGIANIQSGMGAAGAEAAYGRGNAQAAGAIGAGNALSGGIQNALGAYNYNQYMNAASGSGAGGWGGVV